MLTCHGFINSYCTKTKTWMSQSFCPVTIFLISMIICTYFSRGFNTKIVLIVLFQYIDTVHIQTILFVQPISVIKITCNHFNCHDEFHELRNICSCRLYSNACYIWTFSLFLTNCAKYVLITLVENTWDNSGTVIIIYWRFFLFHVINS